MKPNRSLILNPADPAPGLTTIQCYQSFRKCGDREEIHLTFRQGAEKEAVLRTDGVPPGADEHQPVGGMLVYYGNGVPSGKSKLAEMALREPVIPENAPDGAVAADEHVRRFEAVWALAHAHGMNLEIHFFKNKASSAPAGQAVALTVRQLGRLLRELAARANDPTLRYYGEDDAALSAKLALADELCEPLWLDARVCEGEELELRLAKDAADRAWSGLQDRLTARIATPAG